MQSPDIWSAKDKVSKLGAEIKEVKENISLLERWQSALDDAAVAIEISDTDLINESYENLSAIEKELDKFEIKLMLSGEYDEADAILTINAGAGGTESSLFAADLYRMYLKYSESKGWKIENMDSNPSDLGGYKEIIFKITGTDVFKRLKFESGVHRVQRVPATEASGRIHTSTATVAVLPEAQEVDIEIKPEDIEITVCRASGPGGQGVNTTDSAVQINHKPSGMIVRCADQRSQQQNRLQAMTILRSRLLEKKIAEENAKYSAQRKAQVGTGERNERIRTYNFPQSRVSDHRIELTLYNIDAVMEGDLDCFIEPLIAADIEERLQELEKE